MRILVVSNFYPPHFIGGYELGCHDVVEALKRRGHQVEVLTSTYGISKAQTEKSVRRWLGFEEKWNKAADTSRRKLFQREFVNQSAFKKLCREFKPDVVYIWNAAFISISAAFLAKKMRIPVAYYISDDWLARWEDDSWFSFWSQKPAGRPKKAPKELLRGLVHALGFVAPTKPLELHWVQFTSQHLKEKTLRAGKPVETGEVIHWGINVDRYSYRAAETQPRRQKSPDQQTTRLLFVGQVLKHKGVQTAIQALKLLKDKSLPGRVTLTIAGGCVVPEEEEAVRSLVASLGLQKDVRFTGLVPRSELVPLYQEHDILIFPSVWDEPFSITLLEGLASGLAVVGTTTGGSAEILRDGVNALVFPKEDAETCACQVVKLMEPGLYERLRRTGRETVEQKFQFEEMANKIDASLRQIQTRENRA